MFLAEKKVLMTHYKNHSTDVIFLVYKVVSMVMDKAIVRGWHEIQQTFFLVYGFISLALKLH
jgi:hypothetical protein